MVRHLSFQWISSVADVGEGSRSLLPPLPLFLDQTEARRAEKFFWRLGPSSISGSGLPAPTPPPPPPILSQGVDRALVLAQTFQPSQFEQSTHGLTI